MNIFKSLTYYMWHIIERMDLMSINKVLWLDDNPIVKQIYGVLFKNTKIRIHSVFTINEANEWLKKETPDVFIMDLIAEDKKDLIPRIHYIENIHKQFEKTKIVIYTGYQKKWIKEKLNPIIADYIYKSCEPYIFLSKIEALIKG